MANRTPPDARARRQLDRKLSAFGVDDFTRPSHGWVRAIRDALGMTTQQLATRLGVTKSTVTALEQGEVRETVSLHTLRQAAEALGCRLIYLLLPERSLEDSVYVRAQRLADAQLARTTHTMRLEDQALNAEDLASERARLIDDLLRGDPRRLWDEP